MRESSKRILTFGLPVRVAEQNRRVTWKAEWRRDDQGERAGKEKTMRSFDGFNSEFSVNSVVRKG